MIAQFYVLRRLGVSARWSKWIATLFFIVYLLFSIDLHPHAPRAHWAKLTEDLIHATIVSCNLLFVGAAALLLLLRPRKFDDKRRGFLKQTSIAACAVPAGVLGAAVITRKDFHVNEVDIAFPNLPRDLQGLRLLQISDIHMGTFYSAADLRRAVDASNGMRADMVFVTGDLISDEYDPLDTCLEELKRLRSGTGIWGCMGNHEMYAQCQTYTKRAAHRLGMDFLRDETRALKFGNSRLNLLGIDYQHPGKRLPWLAEMTDNDAFNLLLSHNPTVFPEAAKNKIDLTLSGHTHGGQLNLPIGTKNVNIVDLITPYTKGLYRKESSAVYVNSGLGTIGVPMRLGAPPEITVIRLCNS